VRSDILSSMNTPEKQKDVPLPATVAFVVGLGVVIVVGWLLMFRLLMERW